MSLEIQAGAFDAETVVIFAGKGVLKILIDHLGVTTKAERAAQPEGEGIGDRFALSLAGVGFAANGVGLLLCKGAFFG